MSTVGKLRSGLDHRWAEPRLSAYLEGDLTTRQRRRLERHAEACPECGPALRQLRTLLRELPALRGHEPGSTTAADRVAAAVRRRIDDEAADGLGREPPG